jgi:hypothetical protein
MVGEEPLGGFPLTRFWLNDHGNYVNDKNIFDDGKQA